MTVLLTTFVAVFAAEIVGDKLIYTAGVLATRYRPAPMMWGIAAAFAAKMGVAVLVGQAIGKLPAAVLATVTGASFSWVAWRLWKTPDTTIGPARDRRTSEAAAISFAAVFLTEWGDVGQVTAATMAAQFHRPGAVWAGAVLAMMAKAALAALLSGEIMRRVRHRISPTAIRYAGVGLMIVTGVWSVIETVTRVPGSR